MYAIAAWVGSTPEGEGSMKLGALSVSNWNLADVWETVAAQLPAAPALDPRQPSVGRWREFDANANGMARNCCSTTVCSEQDKVAQYLYNSVEYLESMFAIVQGGFRAGKHQLPLRRRRVTYLFDNSDAAAVVFHSTLRRTRRRHIRKTGCPRCAAGCGSTTASGACPDWAVPYGDAGADPGGGSDRAIVSPGRGAAARTISSSSIPAARPGMPKGVMWRQDDLFAILNRSATRRYPEDGGLDDVRAALDAPGFVHLCACPLMHGTGVVSSISALNQGGSVVTLPSRKFHAEELLDVVTDRAGAVDGDRRRRVRAADRRRARCRHPTVGISRAWCSSCRRVCGGATR